MTTLPVDAATQMPRVGKFATVSNRRGVVAAVEPHDGHEGRVHLVHIEYKDRFPVEQRLVGELEPGTHGESARNGEVRRSRQTPAGLGLFGPDWQHWCHLSGSMCGERAAPAKGIAILLHMR